MDIKDMTAKFNQFKILLNYLIFSLLFILFIQTNVLSQRTTPRGSLRSARSAEPIAGDRDRDGLTDEEESQLRTDPNNPDTDGDALLDGWEVHGVNGINLPALNASPLHKDIFIEMDYMRRANATNGLAPDAAVIRAIVDIFAAAPVSNPDGRLGITLHLELGSEVPYDADLNPLFTEFSLIKSNHFNRNRAPIFHYMIWANAYDGGTSSGYSMNIPHSDFIVTLGRWNGNQGGTQNEKIGTFIHELGHNLGRMHGGSEHINFKPNHLSVMSYLFQTRGLKVGNSRVFDYQRFPLPRLNEIALRETDGLCQNTPENYFTIYNTPSSGFVEVLCRETMDWNGNAQIDTPVVSVDLNGDGLLTELLPTPNEWSQIVFKGGAIGSTNNLELLLNRTREQFEQLPFIELSEELDQKIETFLRNNP